jgi:oxygen-independent coproporphyrinogen-3 oxidase
MSAAGNEQIGIYISIPFCRSKCTYCNFASGVYPASEHARYIDRIIDDLRDATRFAAANSLGLPRTVDTIYLGGGTPSVLSPGLFIKLFTAIRDKFAVAADAEITVECAPGQLANDTLAAMAQIGVNRVSLGVQSFVDAEAAQAGRLHTRDIVFTDLARLRDAGIRNINLDLIAGLAGQTFASWQQSLDALIEATPSHASIYMLEVDEDSRLGRELLSGGTRYRAGLVPHEEAIIHMYETGIEFLAAAGLNQYEISNFARPGRESRHNTRYWERRPYLGLGLDASSFLYAAEVGSEQTALRWTETSELGAYLDCSGDKEQQTLTRHGELEEIFFLGLRMNRGIETGKLSTIYPKAEVEQLLAAAQPIISDGLLTDANGTLQLTQRGRLLSNEVFAEFLHVTNS